MGSLILLLEESTERGDWEGLLSEDRGLKIRAKDMRQELRHRQGPGDVVAAVLTRSRS